MDTVAVGRSFESLYSGPTHLLGARPRVGRSFWELLAMADRSSWRRRMYICGEKSLCFLEAMVYGVVVCAW